MARHVWTVLCKTATIDKDTNNLSLIEVIEVLGGTIVAAVQPKAIPFPVILVSLWSRSDPGTAEKVRTRLRLLGPPDGDELTEPTLQEVDLTANNRMRHRVAFPGLPYSGPGSYEFSLEVQDGAEWREVARVPLEVTVEFKQGEMTPPA